MGNAMAFLKKKGPLGMPMGFWVGFVAIGGYLGYRWWSNRSGSSSTSSTGVADGTTTDTIPGGQIDTTEPPTTTTPSVWVQPLEPSTGTGTTTTTTGGNKTKEKKKHPKGRHHEATHHDRKQRMHHTEHRRLPVNKSAHHHAPHKKAKEHSADKAEQTKNITITSGTGAESIRGGATNNNVLAPSPKSRVPKTLPARPKQEEKQQKEHKAPPRKRQRVG